MLFACMSDWASNKYIEKCQYFFFAGVKLVPYMAVKQYCETK